MFNKYSIYLFLIITLIIPYQIFTESFVLADNYSVKDEYSVEKPLSLKDQYSFNKVTTAAYYTNAFKDRKRWFAIGLSYNMNLDGKYSLVNHLFSMGVGVSAELFLTDYLSLYSQYTDSYIIDAEDPKDNNTRVDKVFFGSRFYFNWIYVGIGAMTDYIFYKGNIFTHWDGYFEAGLDLPIARFLSFEINFRMIWGISDIKDYETIDHSFYDDSFITDTNSIFYDNLPMFNYNITLGFKFSI